MCVCPPPHNRPRLPGRVNGAFGVARDGASATIDPADQPSKAAATKGKRTTLVQGDGRRHGGYLSFMRVSYDPEADAAYIYLTEQQLMPGRDSVPVDPPEGMQAMVVLDWKDGKIVGLEVLDAAALLHADLLRQAVRGLPREFRTCN